MGRPNPRESRLSLSNRGGRLRPTDLLDTKYCAMSTDPKTRHQELVDLIRAHDYRYYALDDPTVDDRTYDSIYAELRGLEAQHPELISEDSPTQRVGAPRTSITAGRTLKTVPHVRPMM